MVAKIQNVDLKSKGVVGNSLPTTDLLKEMLVEIFNYKNLNQHGDNLQCLFISNAILPSLFCFQNKLSTNPVLSQKQSL